MLVIYSKEQIMMQKYQALNANKIKGVGLVNKSDIVGFLNNADLDKTVATLASKAESRAE